MVNFDVHLRSYPLTHRDVIMQIATGASKEGRARENLLYKFLYFILCSIIITRYSWQDVSRMSNAVKSKGPSRRFGKDYRFFNTVSESSIVDENLKQNSIIQKGGKQRSSAVWMDDRGQRHLWEDWWRAFSKSAFLVLRL